MKTTFFRNVVLAAAMASIGLTAATGALALPSEAYHLHFYSDATLTTEVGYRQLSCEGHFASGGTETEYYNYTYAYCDPSFHCPDDDCPSDPFGPGGTLTPGGL